MKKIIFINILILIIYGCSSTNERIAPINAYLKEVIDPNDSILIITNKINNNYTLDLWKERVSFKDANMEVVESVDENPRIFEEKYWNLVSSFFSS